MSIFDPKTKFLVLGDKPLDDIIEKYEDSYQYKSYIRYLNEGIQEDIKEKLIPLMNDLFSTHNINFCENTSKVEIKKSMEYIGTELNSVYLTLVNRGTTVPKDKEIDGVDFAIEDKELNPFVALQIPYMDRSGIVYRRGKKYAILNTITLDDSITYDNNSLKFVDNSNSLLISGSMNPKVTMFKNSITAIDLVTMLAKLEYGKDHGVDYAIRFIESLTNSTVINAVAGRDEDFKFLGEDTFRSSIEQLTGALNDNIAVDFRLTEKLEQGFLNTTTTRRQLNEMLSFDNAIGKTISRDIVTSDNKVIAEAGEIVNRTIVRELNRNLIDTIHVEETLRLIGYLIAEEIMLGSVIKKGTPVIEEMVRLIPELKDYSIVPIDYSLDNDGGLMIHRNTSITEELLKYLEYVGIKEIKYKEKDNSNKILTAYFEVEYINNRHFLKSDLNIKSEDGDAVEDLGGYVYVGIDGVIREESDTLTCHDIAALTSLFLKLRLGEHHDLVSDPDSGLRKRVEQSYDHFKKAFNNALTVFERTTARSMKKNMGSWSDYNKPDAMNGRFSAFTENFWNHLFGSLRVIDPLDTSNPVATISSLTKVNTIVKDSNSISDSMRGLSMGHYGRICPYETPQSKKLGIVNNMATGCSIEEGIMYTEYYKLKHEGGKSFISGDPVKMSVVDEEFYRISDITVLNVNKDTGEVTSNGKVPARVPARDSLEKTIFASIDLKDVQYINVSPNQHESIAATTIPYAGGDDATRVSFGLSMVKQAKGLVNGEIPTVCTTGFVNIPNMNDFYKIFAEDDGIVVQSDSKRLTVKYNSMSTPTVYNFEAITLAHDTSIIRVTEVIKGQRIKKGDTLLSSNFIKEGVLVLGVNAIVAYMTDGYNYEDGVPVGRRLSEKLTSYGVHKDEFRISSRVNNIKVRNINYEEYIEKDDKLLDKIETYDSNRDSTTTTIRSHRSKGYIASHETIRHDRGKNTGRTKEIKVQTVSFDELNESDKLCNRHGNKGVTCKVHDNSEMPYFENGEFIDIKYNPNGIVSRMNIGQMLEASSGLACYVLGIRILCGSFNSPSTEDIKRLLSYTVDLANEEDTESVISRYPDMPEELHQHCRENIRKIRHWKGTFNKEGKAYLIDPKSGKRTLTRVNVGVNYVYKLVQEGEGKMHSRGGLLTSDYVEMTESPTKGSSKGGGQKMGYMELDAIASYGASALLKEITNERGDNPIARNNMTVKALHSGEPDYLLDEKDGMRRSVEYMTAVFKSLGLHSEMTQGELLLNNEGDRRYYKLSALKDAKLNGNGDSEPEELNLFESFKNL